MLNWDTFKINHLSLICRRSLFLILFFCLVSLFVGKCADFFVLDEKKNR